MYNIVQLKPDVAFFPITYYVTKWDTEDVAHLVDLSNFRYIWFEEREKHIIANEWIYNVETVILKNSNKFFINAYIETLEDIKVKKDPLLEIMLHNKWDKVVRPIDNDINWAYRFDDGDKLINTKGQYCEI